MMMKQIHVISKKIALLIMGITLGVFSTALFAQANGSFETPAMGSSFQYNPSNAVWIFTGGSGIAGNNSAFTAGNSLAPNGTQVAFLQGNAAITLNQTFSAGTYTVSFLASQRPCCGGGNQSVKVTLDGNVLGQYTPTGTSYTAYTTTPVSISAGTHSLGFVSGGCSGDCTAFVDNVVLTAASTTVSPVKWMGYYGSAGNGWNYATDATYKGGSNFVHIETWGFDGDNPTNYNNLINYLATQIQTASNNGQKAIVDVSNILFSGCTPANSFRTACQVRPTAAADWSNAMAYLHSSGLGNSVLAFYILDEVQAANVSVAQIGQVSAIVHGYQAGYSIPLMATFNHTGSSWAAAPYFDWVGLDEYTWGTSYPGSLYAADETHLNSNQKVFLVPAAAHIVGYMDPYNLYNGALTDPRVIGIMPFWWAFEAPGQPYGSNGYGVGDATAADVNLVKREWLRVGAAIKAGTILQSSQQIRQ